MEENGWDDITALEFLEKEADYFVNSVIDGEIDSSGYTEPFWERSSLHPLEVREHDRFKEEFSKLESDQDDLEVICNEIHSNLKQARTKMMDDYDLVESEVTELKANMNDSRRYR